MNNFRGIIICICVIVTGCNKPLPEYSAPFEYSVNPINDVTMPANDIGYLSAKISLVSGSPVKEPITVTFKGLPPNVTLEKDAITFRANYDLGNTISAHAAAEGIYPMQAIFSNATTGVRSYNFNLIIGPPVNRVAGLIGYYHPSNSCANYVYVSCEIDSIMGMPGHVRFINRTSPSPSLYGVYDTCYGYLDCCSNTFVIPQQRVQNTLVEGNGVFAKQTGSRKVELNRTITTDSGQYSCTVTLE